MKISVNECANTLKEKDNILILTHANPDGDTLGCGYALCRALMKIGKICSVINADNIPKKYNYLFDDIVEIKFKPDYIVAVDVATVNLLGGLEEQYKVDMCIDHHSTNTEYADLLLLEDVPAACQIMYDVVLALGIEVDKKIADCLYTGLTTDTGCFRYDSTTAQTYRVAADLIEAGADNGRINRIMFETKTKTYARLERLAIESMRFYEHERVAVITVTQEMFQLTGSNAQETEGLAPLTRQIEGVEIGITIQEKPDGTCKASIRTFESVNAGIICINKDKDITSFGVVAKIRGITREKKAGHTGTLDPMATGVLPIMLGGATRFLNYLPDSDKGYRAEFMLGKTTDTLDITGNVTGEYEVNVSLADVEASLDDFKGEIEQVPPMYSAVSVDGQRLYDLARRGIEVERQARKVEIKSLSLCKELSNEKENVYTIDVVCSKGTYIRSLIDDLGKKLGTGAVMTALERTLAMGFTLDDCATLGEMQERRNSGKGFEDVLINIEKMFSSFERVYVSPAQAKRFQNGGALDINRIKKKLENKVYTVYSGDIGFLGLGKCDTQKGELSVERLLVKRD